MIEDLHDASRKLDRVEIKLDQILAFQRKLEPYLPMLAKAVTFLDNPASKFRDALGRKNR